MKELQFEELNKILKEKISNQLLSSKDPQIHSLTNLINSYSQTKCVLGFDIYRYSQYQMIEQSLIPHLFKTLYENTIQNCLKQEPNIFIGKTIKDFKNSFIDTGDGGFQIFDNPFEAVIFSIYFQANIIRYNSNNTFTESLYYIIGEINLRYSLTYDKLIFYNKNYYGPAIINCARIMSKDKLNRFLIDKNAIIWFNKELNGIENLQLLTIEDLKKNTIFGNFDKEFKLNETIRYSLIFKSEKSPLSNPNILICEILRIGEIKSKLDTLSIYNFHLQVKFLSKGKKLEKYIVSIGNLNSSGLSE